MAAVWKFPLAFPTLTIEGVTMPAGAKVLHVGMQDRVITLWALVDPDAEPTRRLIATVGTGHSAPAPDEATYLGTVMDGAYVWHVFAEPFA